MFPQTEPFALIMVLLGSMWSDYRPAGHENFYVPRDFCIDCCVMLQKVFLVTTTMCNISGVRLDHCFPTGAPRANAFSNTLKNTFSKCHQTLKQITMGSPLGRGGVRHFHLGGPVLQQGELSMVCVGLSEGDLKNFGGQCPPLAPPLPLGAANYISLL